MNLEKCYLLGEAAANSAKKPFMPNVPLADRPPGAVNTFVGMGIVLSVLEEPLPPETLDDLSDRIGKHDLSEENFEDARRGIVHVRNDGYLCIDSSDWSITFTRPNSSEYQAALLLDD